MVKSLDFFATITWFNLRLGLFFNKQMEEVSLLVDAASRIDEPFLMVIVVMLHSTPSNCGSRNMHWY